MKRKPLLLALGLAALAVAGALLWYFFGQPASEAPATGERKVLYWTDPMVPGYKSDKPGRSPFMDMDLVPVYEDEGTGGPPAVTVRPEMAQNLGVRTTLIARATPTRRLTAHGYLFRADSSLLAIADVFGRDTSWLNPGLRGEVHVPEVPGQPFTAVLDRIESDRDIGGRSVKVRMRLLKTDPRLQANMAADVMLSAPAGKPLLLAPREAVIRTGFRSALIRVLDDGKFQPVEVVTGEEFGEQIEIRSGVKEGEKIVVSGQFLIDSEASVRESLKRMDTPAESMPVEHKH